MTRRLIPLAAIVLVGAFMALPMFARMDRLPNMIMNDWGEVYFHQAAARESVLSGAGIPFWCPYVNGGYPLASHPYDPSLSPLFPITLVFGEVAGTRILLFLVFLAGLWGMWASSRRIFNYSPLEAFAATSVYAASGWLPMRFFGGNFNECLLYAFPALAFCISKGRASRGFAVLAGLILYTMMAQGKYVYPVSIFYLLLWWAVERVFSRGLKSDERTFSFYAICAGIVISCLLGITRIYLLGEIISLDSRNYDYSMMNSNSSLYESLYYIYHFFIRIHDFSNETLVMNGQMYVSVANNMYRLENKYIGCGILALIFALIWLVANFGGKNKGLSILSILTALLAVTNYFPIDIYRPLGFLPVFHNIKYPAKYFNYFLLLFIAIGVGGFFNAFCGHLKKDLRSAAALVLLVFLVLPGMWRNSSIIPLAFTHPRPARWVKADAFFNVDYGDLYPNLLQGYGLLRHWCGNIVLSTSVVPAFLCTKTARQVGTIVRCAGQYARNPAYSGEVGLENGYGAVSDFKTGYNRTSFFVSLFGPDTVIVNQNWASGWKTDRGIVTRKNGLLAVRFDKPFSGPVTLSYRPPHIGWVLALNLLAVLGLLLWAFFRPFRARPGLSAPGGNSVLSLVANGGDKKM